MTLSTHPAVAYGVRGSKTRVQAKYRNELTFLGNHSRKNTSYTMAPHAPPAHEITLSTLQKFQETHYSPAQLLTAHNSQALHGMLALFAVASR
jgi:hypothetical protein